MFCLCLQLHTIVADENCFLIMEVYTNFVEGLSSQHLRAESRARLELACQKKVESLLSDQNCYKITCVRIFLIHTLHACPFKAKYMYTACNYIATTLYVYT